MAGTVILEEQGADVSGPGGNRTLARRRLCDHVDTSPGPGATIVRLVTRLRPTVTA